ncbi:TlpA family protein disulfide reductase [Candidatus Poriferisodalis sp.]|uniref:TlpA family protein disulfide reductase n=1 Tax=Candidatus Poriferisodalis sp. TaxID=3101277 RepID=UPI003B028F6F
MPETPTESTSPPIPTTAAPTPETTGVQPDAAPEAAPDDSTAVAGCRAIDPLQPAGVSDPEGAHAFTFTGFNGSAGSLSGYAGCGLMINFFASWCSPCVAEMPDFEEFWQRHGHRVAVLGLAREDSAEDALEMIATTGITYPTGMDSTDLFITLGGLGMPTTVFISPEGAILDAYSGLMTADVILEFADRYFGPLN